MPRPRLFDLTFASLPCFLLKCSKQTDKTNMALQPQPNLVTLGYHVQVVQYDNQESLRYALNGVDTVISTVSGPPQYKLIEAAVQKRIRRFAPAEFDGIPSLRPADDPLDRDRANALRLLEHYKAYMQYTVFACGIFYERFAPGGMAATGLGRSSGISGEGDYLLNIRNMAGEAPLYNSSNQHSVICMTAVQDVARFVVRAVDLADWPPVLSMYSERMIVYQFVGYVQQLTGKSTSFVHELPLTLCRTADDLDGRNTRHSEGKISNRCLPR